MTFTGGPEIATLQQADRYASSGCLLIQTEVMTGGSGPWAQHSCRGQMLSSLSSPTSTNRTADYYSLCATNSVCAAHANYFTTRLVTVSILRLNTKGNFYTALFDVN